MKFNCGQFPAYIICNLMFICTITQLTWIRGSIGSIYVYKHYKFIAVVLVDTSKLNKALD